ncbi:MAG: cell division ATP-binding protein FtsE [Clostridia bacterium]|nr:cell division ATP-binding protein FtsE [Clostridia bacterium]
MQTDTFEINRISDKPVIEFKGVSKTYATGTHAIEDVNIRINRGEFVFVVGSSGAGKSTFMKLIMREEKANTGTVMVNGFNLTKMTRNQIPMLRRTMGIVFQDFRLIPTMNVFDNVAFAMRVVGASDKEIRLKVPKALSKVGLGDKAHSMPMQLSGGEQQRVGLARALVNSPDLIIADEPTGNVDPNMSYDIVSLLTEINKRGTTILMVTHDHNLVRDFQHRVIMLDSGRIVADNAAGGAE